jgi:hypothetical protein
MDGRFVTSLLQQSKKTSITCRLFRCEILTFVMENVIYFIQIPFDTAKYVLSMMIVLAN